MLLNALVSTLTAPATVLLAALLGVLPSPVAGPPVVCSLVPLAVIYYWSVHAPSRLPPVAVFVVGFIQDALTGTPLGLMSLVFLLAQALVGVQRRHFAAGSFAVVWFFFLPVVVPAALAWWAAGSFFAARLLPLDAAATEAGVAILAYPLVSRLMAGVQSRVASPHASRI